jgi:hypothetical protein
MWSRRGEGTKIKITKISSEGLTCNSANLATAKITLYTVSQGLLATPKRLSTVPTVGPVLSARAPIYIVHR